MTNQNALPEEPPRDETGQDLPAGFPDPTQSASGTAAVPAVNEERSPGDPATEVDLAATTTDEEPATKKRRAFRQGGQEKQRTPGSIAGSTWVALVIGLLLLLLLIIFILQNQQQIVLNLFAWTFQFPAGVGYLITAITGGLIVAMVGMVRMIELHREVRKMRKKLR